jgi:hypothetical protein
MTSEGEEIDAIHEHEDEQSSESNFAPSDFGEDSPDNSVSKSGNPPYNLFQKPDLRVKTYRKGHQTGTGVKLSPHIVSHQTT